MSRDPFSILGLTPGRYEPGEIDRRFRERRRRLLATLADPARYTESRRQLDELHRAYNTLRASRRQSEYLHSPAAPETDDQRVEYLRRLIAASLEGGLLRCSRRLELLEEGRRLGFSDFHTHLLIAQVQFGGEILARPERCDLPHEPGPARRAAARLATAGVLAVAIFFALLRWLGI